VAQLSANRRVAMGRNAIPEITAMKTMPPVSSHDRILMSAKRLFACNGYENTSTIAIAREAGTSESQLMKHFGSKQGLLSAIFEGGWENIGHRVRSAGQNAAGGNRLFAALEALALELETDPELKDLITLESHRIRKDTRDVLMTQGFQRFVDEIEGILEDMRRRGQIGADISLEAVRAAVIGMTEGLLRDPVVARRSGTPAHYNFEDMRKTLGVLLGAFDSNGSQPAKAVAR